MVGGWIFFFLGGWLGEFSGMDFQLDKLRSWVFFGRKCVVDGENGSGEG